ncbi:MAG: hypothetical protein IKJ76_07990 [Fibrobacter sp.]|nr:hypothetical protein [Fibrobacter sp.]
MAIFLVGGTAFAQDTVYVIQVVTPAQAEALQAQDNPDQSAKEKRPKRRSSFYLNGGLGFDYSYIYYDHLYYDEHTQYDGTGAGIAGELSLGFLFKELIAVHGIFDFSIASGEYDLENGIRERPVLNGGYYQRSGNDNDAFGNDFETTTLMGGAGITFFPWLHNKPNSFMGGTFINADLLMGIILLDDPYYFDIHGNSQSKDWFAFAMNLEIGKDWKVSERTYVGLALKWQILGIASGDDMEGEDDYENYYHHNHVMNSFQLLFRVNRK